MARSQRTTSPPSILTAISRPSGENIGAIDATQRVGEKGLASLLQVPEPGPFSLLARCEDLAVRSERKGMDRRICRAKASPGTHRSRRPRAELHPRSRPSPGLHRRARRPGRTNRRSALRFHVAAGRASISQNQTRWTIRRRTGSNTNPAAAMSLPSGEMAKSRSNLS